MIALTVASFTRPDNSQTITRSPTTYRGSLGFRLAAMEQASLLTGDGLNLGTRGTRPCTEFEHREQTLTTCTFGEVLAGTSVQVEKYGVLAIISNRTYSKVLR